MAKRYHIVLGDKTSAGGTVVAATSIGTINGKTIALEGDAISCPACKKQGAIICIGPRIPEMWNGKQVALESDLCACGCSPHPVLLPSQSLRYQTTEGSGSPTTGAASEPAPLMPVSKFDRCLLLQDHETNAVFKNQRYKAESSLGTFEGVTDAAGYTQAIPAKSNNEQIQVWLLGD